MFAPRFSFEFLCKSGNTIASIQNMSEQELKKSAKYAGYSLQDKRQESFTLEDNEIIVGVDMGVRSSSNVTNLKFIMVRL